ncbi:hypothetical protein [Paracidovorax konjaci]|uniref:YfhG lipoprotein n=1 Tax=Paracidovorax konjaci TaxID=32040 RepID=A0A1I1VX98_9BURK|nr:hypothetical protein [Paracidovorax konjaci]SFD85210.1 hypothetical protein SAMN04489710_10779 [Paracidovorax konjaci]
MLPDPSMPRTVSRALPERMRAWPVACLALWGSLALGGCTTPPPPAEPPPAVLPAPVPPPMPDTDKSDADAASAPATGSSEPESAPSPARAAVSVPRQMLQYADRVRTLSPPEITAEIAQLSDAQSANGSPEKTLQLALALLQTRQPADTARSLGLVQKVLGDARPAAAALHPLSRLLENRLLQQRRLEDQLDRQGQQLKDGQRRIDQLNERLEAMRAIERSLNARPGAPGNGKTAPPPAPTDSPR